MKILLLTGLLVASFAIWGNISWCMQELSDEEMDQVAAGGLSAEVIDGTLHFKLSDVSGEDLSIDGDGTISFNNAQVPGSLGVIVLHDNAQSNLNSFININAVNSAIQVLINLNLNVNSSVGSLHQINLAGGF